MATRTLPELQLRLLARLLPFRLEAPVAPVGLQFTRFHPVMDKLRQDFVDNFVTQVWLLDRKRNFDSPEKIARHPIGAGKKHFPLAGILKIINPAVLEKTARQC